MIYSVLILKRNINTFILTSDRVSKELSASAKSLSKSRECFIDIYIDNQCLFVIVYRAKCYFAECRIFILLC